VDYGLALSAAALALAFWSLWRSYVPPQTRQVNQLTGRVEDLELAHDDIRQRLTRRAQTENMAKARATHEERAARRDAVEEHAAEIIRTARQGPAPMDLNTELGRAAAKAQLRKSAPWTNRTGG